MGTPDFAVGILNTLYKSEFEIAAVITAPDKPAGRGRKIHQSAVKEYALSQKLPILQPTNLKNEDLKGYADFMKSKMVPLEINKILYICTVERRN